VIVSEHMVVPNDQVNRRAGTDARQVEVTNRRVRLNAWLGRTVLHGKDTISSGYVRITE